MQGELVKKVLYWQTNRIQDQSIFTIYSGNTPNRVVNKWGILPGGEYQFQSETSPMATTNLCHGLTPNDLHLIMEINKRILQLLLIKDGKIPEQIFLVNCGDLSAVPDYCLQETSRRHRSPSVTLTRDKRWRAKVGCDQINVPCHYQKSESQGCQQ